MDYWKIKKSIREVLEQKKEKVSDRAEARVIGMSQKGYTSMMEKHTMTVKKLEEIASVLNKDVSYFFVTTDKNEKQEKAVYKNEEKMQVVEDRLECLMCAEKEKRIADKVEIINGLKGKIELLEFSLGKNLKTGSE